MNEVTDFLVIGAGLAGLAFAREVQAQGASVQVLDKGRGVGGRAATRRFGAARIDHGAQFFTARDAAFQAVVDGGLRDGWIREWYRSIPEWREGAIHSRPDGYPRYACPEGISALPKFLAQGLTVTTEADVQSISWDDIGYVATTKNGQHFAGTTLILNVPPVQLLTLAELLLTPEDAERIATATLEPCWALLALLETDLAVDWPALELTGHPVFSWIARDHTKRGESAPPTLVAHTAPGWTAAHLEDSAEAVAAALSSELAALLGPLAIRQTQAHRWRYAKPVTALGQPFFWDTARQLGACGDWCEGRRIEGAFLSGHLLAKAC